MSEQRKYRSWTAQQKLEIALAGLRGDREVKELCREHAISEALFYGWREKLLEGGREALAGKEERAAGRAGAEEADRAAGAGAWSEDPRARDPDKIDARVLAELVRRDFVPGVRVPPFADRALLEQLLRADVPDGKTLASTGDEGAVVLLEGILWNDDLGYLEAMVCGLVHGILTGAEWETLAPGLPYRTTCPS